jgi:hypothetical protein
MVAQDARTGGVPLVRLQPVVDELPADFDTIRAEARAEVYRFLDRLANDWASGTMRFKRPDKALLAAYSEGVLAAIAGITIDTVHSDALRMRRFYVRSAFRRAGIRREDCPNSPENRKKRSSGDPQCRCQECSVLGNSGVRAASSRWTYPRLA